MDAHTAYSWGVTAGLAGSLLHAGGNILDSYLSNRLRQRLSDLVALSATTNLLFVPLSAAIDPPQWIGGRTLIVVVLISCINVFYHFPYYRALQGSDTSVVSSLFSLGKLLTPPLAFLILKESLAPIQYVGFIVIVIASALLTFDRSRFRFQKALPYMFCVSFALILQAILFKKLYEGGVSWGTSVVWTGVMDFGVASLLMWSQGRGRDLGSGLGGLGRERILVLANQFLSWGGEVLGLYALTLIPVSVFEGVDSGQPMFVLLISMVCARRFPQLLKENLELRHLGGKAVLFVVMAVGTLMIVRHD
jgi:drug/metabolite transporter (DMT)-like permease